jgi:hypothetical protein
MVAATLSHNKLSKILYNSNSLSLECSLEIGLLLDQIDEEFLKAFNVEFRSKKKDRNLRMTLFDTNGTFERSCATYRSRCEKHFTRLFDDVAAWEASEMKQRFDEHMAWQSGDEGGRSPLERNVPLWTWSFLRICEEQLNAAVPSLYEVSLIRF